MVDIDRIVAKGLEGGYEGLTAVEKKALDEHYSFRECARRDLQGITKYFQENGIVKPVLESVAEFIAYAGIPIVELAALPAIAILETDNSAEARNPLLMPGNIYEEAKKNPGKAARMIGTIAMAAMFAGCTTPQGKLSIIADREGKLVGAEYNCVDPATGQVIARGVTGTEVTTEVINAFEGEKYSCSAEYEEVKVTQTGIIGKGDYPIAFLFPKKDLITDTTGSMLPLKQGCEVKVRVMIGDKETKTELKYGAVDGGERIPVDAPATLYLGERYPLFIIASSCLDENGVNPTIPNHEIPDYKVTCDPVKDNLVLKAKECVVPVTDGPSVPPVNPMTGQTVGQTPSTGTTIECPNTLSGRDQADKSFAAIKRAIEKGGSTEDCGNEMTLDDDGEPITLGSAGLANVCAAVGDAGKNQAEAEQTYIERSKSIFDTDLYFENTARVNAALNGDMALSERLCDKARDNEAECRVCVKSRK